MSCKGTEPASKDRQLPGHGPSFLFHGKSPVWKRIMTEVFFCNFYSWYKQKLRQEQESRSLSSIAVAADIPFSSFLPPPPTVPLLLPPSSLPTYFLFPSPSPSSSPFLFLFFFLLLFSHSETQWYCQPQFRLRLPRSGIQDLFPNSLSLWGAHPVPLPLDQPLFLAVIHAHGLDWIGLHGNIFFLKFSASIYPVMPHYLAFREETSQWILKIIVYPPFQKEAFW